MFYDELWWWWWKEMSFLRLVAKYLDLEIDPLSTERPVVTKYWITNRWKEGSVAKLVAEEEGFINKSVAEKGGGGFSRISCCKRGETSNEAPIQIGVTETFPNERPLTGQNSNPRCRGVNCPPYKNQRNEENCRN